MAKRKLTEREQLQLQSDREMSVYKRDDMIQKSRFTLTLQEQKCVLFAASKIKPTDDVFQEYTFELGHFCKLCGLQGDSYTELKETLLGLKQKSWWMETAPGIESTVSWFNKVRTNKREGKVTIRFDDDMMPYLLKLAEQGAFYTSYNLQYILPMSSQYSPRLYEILKSYQKNNREWFFEIDELKRLLDCQNYGRWPDFRRYALEPAIKEINEYTDLNVAYDTEKQGRKVVRVIFFMAKKNSGALLDAKRAGSNILDGQLDFESIMAELMSEDNVRRQFWKDNPPERPEKPSEGV